MLIYILKQKDILQKIRKIGLQQLIIRLQIQLCLRQKDRIKMQFYQQEKQSLQKLKYFLQQISNKSDPYWLSILQSDIRNIIPKYEVCKIELVKNNLSKIRLIMQNLNTFISLQVQKKHIKQEMIDLNQNISKQLQQIVNKQRDNQKVNIQNNKQITYDINIKKKRKQYQLIFKQLSRNKTSNQLKELIQRNNKWKQYIEKNIKTLQSSSQCHLHEDIINFISTYQSLFNIHQNQQYSNSQNLIYAPNTNTVAQIITKSGNYTKLYQNKLHQNILINQLVNSVYGFSQQIAESDPNQYWSQQVTKIRNLHQI